MAGTKSELLVSVYPRIIVREVGRLTMVDYDMYSTCERLNDRAGLRLASWVERYYERYVSRVQRAAIKRWHGTIYVGSVSGRIVVKPDDLDRIVRFVSNRTRPDSAYSGAETFAPYLISRCSNRTRSSASTSMILVSEIV